MYIFLIFSCFFVWASSFSFEKLAMVNSAPLFVNAFRMLLAGGILTLIYSFKKEKNIKILFKKFALEIFLIAFLGYYLANFFEFYSLNYLSVAKTCFIYSLTPFLSAVCSYVQLKEPITMKKIIGISLGVTSYTIFLLIGGGKEEGLLVFSWPEISLLAATLLSSFGWTLIRKVKKSLDISVLGINSIAMLLSGGFSLVHSFVTENWNPWPVTNGPIFFKSFLLLIILSNLICYNVYSWLLKKFSSTFLSLCGLISPLFSSFFGWIFLKEEVTWLFHLSLIINIMGFWIVYKEESKSSKVKQVPLT